mgnify:CR=1 FL=1
MQELDLESVNLTNPTDADFTWRYNGTPYTILAKETKQFAKPVAYHLAKHLSTQMVTSDIMKTATKKDMENPNAAIHVKAAQLTTYDTHERRIALYKILGDQARVVEVVTRHPFKGFIGEMSIYQEFVEKKEAPVA